MRLILTIVTISLLSLGTSVSLSAQKYHLGAKLAGAGSTVPVDYSGADSDMNFYWAGSLQYGLYLYYEAPDKTIFGVDVLVNNVRGEEDGESFYNDGVNNLPMKLDMERSYRYLSLPVFIGYKVLDKLSLNLGLQYSYLFYAKHKSEKDVLNQYNKWVRTKQESKPDLKSWNLGPRVGILWQITPNIGVEANYYHSLWNYVESRYGTSNWQIRQVAVGVRAGA